MLLTSNSEADVMWGLRFSGLEFKDETERVDFIADTLIDMLHRKTDVFMLSKEESYDEYEYPLVNIGFAHKSMFSEGYNTSSTLKPEIDWNISDWYIRITCDDETIRCRFNLESKLTTQQDEQHDEQRIET
jgi:hypothetical protein